MLIRTKGEAYVRFKSAAGPGLQVFGACAAVAGVVVLFGVGWALLVGGVALAGVGVLHEAGWI